MTDTRKEACEAIMAQRRARHGDDEVNALIRALVAEREAVNALPKDIAAALLKIGRVEWGSTAHLTDEEHVAHLTSSIAVTRENFGIEGKTAFQGVYLEGTETVLCHTGMSPNSAQHARIIVGAWNRLVEIARIDPALKAPAHD